MHVHNARLRHGHAPGHVRDTFTKAVEEFLNWKPGHGRARGQLRTLFDTDLARLHAGLDCTDMVSGDLVDRLSSDLELKSRTYAAYARAMLADIRLRLGR
ncbi:hypothetical protein [Bradyrhizobium sp. CW1]|uniref:hypothetical protein n=1 Tax=Bradyrhizobium sp. CW1 TaxID=2782686 RepID=UPI001FFF4139|nr:hypothetical protein [Bradyrhizobium sp. CW1]UPJ25412.1 hypothetical protein IVB54_26595 [Bradyrhizobium sp. CW1]